MQKILKEGNHAQQSIYQICSACYNEHICQYQQALEAWSSASQVCGNVASERIIANLIKSGGTKDKIEEYGEKVFRLNPEIGLKLFINSKDKK